MKILLSFVIALLTTISFVTVPGFSENPDDKKIVDTVASEVSGDISVIGKKMIAIIYKYDTEKGIEYEMNYLIDNDTVFQHVKGLEDLKIGDTVIIKYIDTITEDSDKNRSTERKAAVISVIKAAANKSGLSSSESDNTH